MIFSWNGAKLYVNALIVIMWLSIVILLVLQVSHNYKITQFRAAITTQCSVLCCYTIILLCNWTHSNINIALKHLNRNIHWKYRHSNVNQSSANTHLVPAGVQWCCCRVLRKCIYNLILQTFDWEIRAARESFEYLNILVCLIDLCKQKVLSFIFHLFSFSQQECLWGFMLRFFS